MANGFSRETAPMFAFNQAMDQRNQQREMFPIKKEQAKANVEGTLAQAAAQRSSTRRAEEMHPLQKQEAELNLKKKEQLWNEFQAQAPMREAMNKVGIAKAEFLEENTEKIIGQLSTQMEIDQQKMSMQQIEMEHALAVQYGDAIVESLDNGDAAAANVAYENYVNDHIDTFGKPPSISKEVPIGSITADARGDIKTLTNIARNGLEYVRARDLQREKDAAAMERTQVTANASQGSSTLDTLESMEEYRENARPVITNSIATKTGAQVTSDGSLVIGEDGPQNAIQDTQAFAEELTGTASQLRGIVQSPETEMSNFAQRNFEYGQFMIEDKWGPNNVETSGFYPKDLGTKEEVQTKLQEQIQNVEAQQGIKMNAEQKSQYANQLLSAMRQQRINQFANQFLSEENL